MKNLLLLLLILSVHSLVKAQSACCIKATDDFAALGNIKAFRMEHKAPMAKTLITNYRMEPVPMLLK